MGRSNAMPRSLCGAIDPRHQVTRNNVIFVGVLALIGSFFLTFGRGIELLNFGALIAFMGVNAAAFVRYFLHAEEKKVWNFIPPVLGFLICFALWLLLNRPAQIVGG